MLVQLFGSKTRVALLKLFFDNAERPYFVRELTRELDAQINSVRRELGNLVEIGIVEVVEEMPVMALEEWEEVPKGLNKRKFYRLNKFFVLHDELFSLFSKSHLVVEKDLMDQLAKVRNLELLVMTGVFTGNTNTKTDVLMVGKVDRQEVSSLISTFEQKLEKEINYTIMPVKEFEYRREITDRFLYDILVNHKKLILVDRLGVSGK